MVTSLAKLRSEYPPLFNRIKGIDDSPVRCA
jgi:hypothetical protein